jgi:hypothetical protein
MSLIPLFILLLIALPAGALNQTNSTIGDPGSLRVSDARPCSREDLSLKEGETDAAMGGVRVTEFLFTNHSSSACTLKGYPGAELLNRKGIVSRRATKSEPQDGGEKLVTLAPGKDAAFNVYFNNGGAGHVGKPCPTYPKIRIIAPGTTRFFVLRTDIQSCPRSQFQVSSVFEPTPE